MICLYCNHKTRLSLFDERFLYCGNCCIAYIYQESAYNQGYFNIFGIYYTKYNIVLDITDGRVSKHYSNDDVSAYLGKCLIPTKWFYNLNDLGRMTKLPMFY